MHSVAKHVDATPMQMPSPSTPILSGSRWQTTRAAPAPMPTPGYLGPRSMAERLAGIGASYEVERTAGRGTRVRLLPLRDSA